MAYLEMKPYIASASAPIYGAEWAGTSDPSWTRTDAASSFSDPNPYYAGMSTTPSSPFDNISPWKDLVVSEDSEAGTLVSIPKFYYKWTRTGDKMKLQISMHQYDGFFTSPAHADRGDGKGERDIVYVGRYLCASDYKSKTNAVRYNNVTRATSRAGIHSLGSTVWQYDYAMYWTLCMLYLVEFAHWNSQEKFHFPYYDTVSGYNTGETDSMPYHTGKATKGCQYRHIENFFELVTFCDGILFTPSKCYVTKNPANFSDSITYGVEVGDTLQKTNNPNNTVITSWSNPSVSGYEYALIPKTQLLTSSSVINTYITDGIDSNTSYDTVVTVGSGKDSNDFHGLFRIDYSFVNNSYATRDYIHFRLMKLP